MTVSRLLSEGVKLPITIRPDACVLSALPKLESEDVGALIVSSDGRVIVGIISERDIVRGLESYGHEVLEHEIRDLMTPEVVSCSPTDSLLGVMALMDHHQIRHIPVVNNGVLIGIVSIRDIVRLRLNEVEWEANAMREYITH